MSLTARIEVVHLPATIVDSYGSRIDNADVYIAIDDAETSQPTNGNNCVVTYTINDNGSISTQQITVPGIRVLIYSGVIGSVTFNSSHIVTSYQNKTFSYVSITGGDEPVGVPPIPGVCDLKIVNIAVDTPESAIGAADAQITVNATSSYLPIQYILNDTIFSASNIFTNLTGGLNTVTVNDANGCTSEATINIPILNNLLVSDPSVTLSGGNVSRWSAAFNPVVFTYQRQDFTIKSIAEDSVSGNALLTINADITGVLAGDMVYIETGKYKGTYEVMGTVNGSGILIDTPFIGTDAGFININSLRPYYQMLTRITYVDKLSGQQKTIISTNRPDGKGITRADISNFLQSILHTKDESDFTETNYRDDNLSASYQIAYAQQWDTPTGTHISPYIPITEPYYVLYAAKQLGEHYGGNLAAYVPFSTVPNGAEKARWVTDFAEPAYSNGYPFDIGFIYGDDLVGRQLYCELTLLDINRNPLSGGPENTYLLNDDGSWLLNQDGSRMIIARQSMAAMPVPERLGLNRLLIDGPFSPDAYFINVTLKYNDGEIPRTVTKTQTIRIDDAVDDQSVYLRWIGLSGSWNYYRFVYNQEVSLDVQNAVIIKNYVFDWENQDGIEEVISKTAGQKMKVVAEDLPVADIKGLQSIKYSPRVQILVNKNPVKWQTIVINTATYSEYETRYGRAPFSVMFNMPGINIQTQ